MTFDQWCAFIFALVRREDGMFDFGPRGSRVYHVNGMEDGRGAVVHNGRVFAFIFDSIRNAINVKCDNGDAWTGSPSGVATAIKGSNESGPRFFALPTEGKGSGRGAARGAHKGNNNGNVGSVKPGDVFARWAAQATDAARDLRAMMHAETDRKMQAVKAFATAFGDDAAKSAYDAVVAESAEIDARIVKAFANIAETVNANIAETVNVNVDNG